MFSAAPILACSSMRFSAGDIILIYSIIGGWLAGLSLAFVNPFMICFMDTNGRAKAAHLMVWAAYFGSGLTVWLRGLNGMQSEMWLVPIFGTPIGAAAHFIVLLWIRRQIRLRKQAV